MVARPTSAANRQLFCQCCEPLRAKATASTVLAATEAYRARLIFSRTTPSVVEHSVEGADDDADLPPGKTGWNHNQPDETSSFWEGKESMPLNGENGQEEASETSNEPRTGWLHNTQPSEAAQKDTKKKSAQTSQARRRLEQAMKEQQQNHRMVSPPSFHACGEGRCLVVTEHMFSVPLNYDIPRSPRIDVFFSVVEKASDENRMWFQELAALSPKQRALQYVQRIGLQNGEELMLYLQGGPGYGSPTPVVSLGFSAGSSWAAAALDHYSRVVLMDQRGTGRSTPITKQTLETKYPNLFLLDNEEGANTKSLQDFKLSHSAETETVEKAVQETTEYMAQFRADNIVRDAEEVKDVLMLPPEEPVTVCGSGNLASIFDAKLRLA